MRVGAGSRMASSSKLQIAQRVPSGRKSTTRSSVSSTTTCGVPQASPTKKPVLRRMTLSPGCQCSGPFVISRSYAAALLVQKQGVAFFYEALEVAGAGQFGDENGTLVPDFRRLNDLRPW